METVANGIEHLIGKTMEDDTDGPPLPVGLVDELRDLNDKLEAREAEIQSLRADVELLKKDREQASGQMASLERSCRMLAMQVLRLGGPGLPGSSSAAAGSTHQKSLYAASSPAGARSACAAVPAGGARAGVQAGPVRAVAPQTIPASIVHWDTYEPFRAVVQSTAARWSATYCEDASPAAPQSGTRRVLVLNLLGPGAIQWIRDQARLNPRRTSAFTYAFDCGRGMLLGMIDFLPLSLDVRADVERYLENQGPRRILIVGGDFDVVSHMQETLGRHNCHTSTALNSKQAIDLMPTIKPDLVMLDMRLPRESSVRLAHQIRQHPIGNRNLPVTLFWRERADLADFHDQTQHALRDAVLTADDLGRGLSQVLSPISV